jgi:indole-3-glycerol phosphate synthase
MHDFLDLLAADAKATVDSGYYERGVLTKPVAASLKKAILNNRGGAVIAEVKGASPSRGKIRQDFSPAQIAQDMVQGGAIGVSVLTEPKYFKGSLSNIAEVRQSVNVPVLMKDIVVSPLQLEAASKLGANAVLLIQAVFDRGYCDSELPEMVAKAHSKNLEVLLEAHSAGEFVRAVQSEADLLGINNRNLCTLDVDLNVTKSILSQCQHTGRVIVSESGVTTPDDLRFLREFGADAFLIGSSIMSADNVEAKIREFVKAQ